MRTRVSRTILTASASFIRPSAAALPVIPLLLAQKTAARRSLIRTGEAETERKKQNIEMFGDSIRTSPVYAHQRRGPVRLMSGSGIFFLNAVLSTTAWEREKNRFVSDFAAALAASSPCLVTAAAA